MRLLFTKDFEKEIRKLKNKVLARQIEDAVLNVKQAANIAAIRNLKKLKGHSNAYRIRAGEYRIGVYIDGNVVEFACFMNRKEIYRYFP
jgi:mRNA interferase RelE/StbE